MEIVGIRCKSLGQQSRILLVMLCIPVKKKQKVRDWSLTLPVAQSIYIAFDYRSSLNFLWCPWEEKTLFLLLRGGCEGVSSKCLKLSEDCVINDQINVSIRWKWSYILITMEYGMRAAKRIEEDTAWWDRTEGTKSGSAMSTQPTRGGP